jgi:hypothetical protein
LISSIFCHLQPLTLASNRLFNVTIEAGREAKMCFQSIANSQDVT